MKPTFLFPMIILAGGLATRLRPLTETIPKALITVHNEPFIAHQLRLIHQQGIRDVILCLGYLGEQIVDFVGDGHRFGLNVSYVFDGPTLLGTAGAIKRALSYFPHPTFFVLNGDSYLPCDYSAVQASFLKSQKKALMTVFHNQTQWDTSNIEFANHTIHQYDKINHTEKMHHIDYGLEIFTKEVFIHVPDHQPTDLSAIYQILIKNNQLAAHEVFEQFYENGSFTGISKLEYYLSEIT